MPTMKGGIAVLAGAVLLAMTTGCGEQRADGPGGDRSRDGAGERVGGDAGSPDNRMALDCPTSWRSSGIWEDWNGIEGEASPAAVARPFVYDPAGESLTVTKNRHGADAWILRADETARAVLDIEYEAEYGGWHLISFEMCADTWLVSGTRTLPAKQLAHEFGYTLDPPSARTPAITETEAIEAAYRFGLSRYPQLRAAAVRSVYSPDRGTPFDHRDMWVLAFDAMVPKWGVSQPPGFNKPNPLVPGTAVVFVDARTGEVPSMLSW
jgi:hypothetical protein